MSAGPQAMFVVEYPCDQFCHIEVELNAEAGHLTLQQMWEKANEQHRQVHEPETAGSEPSQGAATSLFRSAPGRGVERRR